jgi:V/A-type H+-transporting ATPase subunit A
VLLTGALLRDAVLQQSSLSADDAYCAPAKQAALLDLVLALHERFQALLARGVPAAAIEAVDLSEAVRARETTPPDGADAVAEIAARTLARLEELG